MIRLFSKLLQIKDVKEQISHKRLGSNKNPCKCPSVHAGNSVEHTRGKSVQKGNSETGGELLKMSRILCHEMLQIQNGAVPAT